MRFEKGTEPSIETVRPILPSSPLQTKLRIPPLHPLSISRPRLIAQLNKWREYKLTVIAAPAGFGKTTLLSEWADQRDFPVVWISLDESDNDPAQFWAYIMAGLLSLSGKPDRKALQRLYPDPLDIVLAKVTELISTLSQEFVLILDDYHSIHNQQIHTALTSLLNYLPEQVHLCIASRTRPPFPLPRLQAYRQLHELDPGDILFTVEELETFLTRALGKALPTGQALAIKTRTGGWIATVHLISIWLQEQPDGWNALERIPGTLRSIFAYLAEEVLQRQSQGVQSFLLQTSILEQCNRDLCQAVTGLDDAQQMLEQIERTNLFIISQDHQHYWYSYHQIFKTFLRERLMQTLPEQIPILHQRACTWYERHAMSAGAIAHALAIPDFEKAIHNILKAGETMLMRGAANTLVHWLQALPEELIRPYPSLCLFYAWSLMMLGQFDAAKTWMGSIDSLPGASQPAQADAMGFSPYIQSVLVVLQAHLAIFWGEVNDIAGLAMLAQENLPPENILIYTLNMLNLGVAKWLGKDYIAAKQAFADAATGGKRLNNTYILLAADCGLMLIHKVQGRRRLAFAIAQQALQLASTQRSSLSPFSIYLYTETCYLLYEWNRLDEATHYAQEVLAYGEKQNQDILIYGYTILSQIRQAQGDLNAARELIQRAEHCIPLSRRRPWVISRLAEQYVRLSLAYNDIERATTWSRVPELAGFGALEIILPMCMHLSQNNPGEALKLAQEYVLSEDDDALFVVILRAVAYQKRGEISRVYKMLDIALRWAEPEGYIRFFLDRGPVMAQMLSAQSQKYKDQAGENSMRLITYIDMLLDEFAKEPNAAAVAQEKPISRLATTNSVLSQRELTILQGLAAGLSPLEIARQMTVAESTVRWHMKSIYSKLHVHNRVQAILEARKHHLV